VFLRAIPEYVWAFLFLAMLGPSAWPAVLALAIHNSGILGEARRRDDREPRESAAALARLLGAPGAQIGFAAVAPLGLTRFLLYSSTASRPACAKRPSRAPRRRLARVLDPGRRARHWYDEMLFFVALGAGIVLLGDLVSAIARAYLRKAT
jgi:phosphonate transport system permease protein